MITLHKYFVPVPRDRADPGLPLAEPSDAALPLVETPDVEPEVDHALKKPKVSDAEVDKLLDAVVEQCRFCTKTFSLGNDRFSHEAECGYMKQHAWSRLKAPIGVLNDGMHIDWFVGGLSGDMIAKLKSVVDCSGPIANMQSGNWWPLGCSVCILGKSHLHRGLHKGSVKMKRTSAREYEDFMSTIGSQWLVQLAQQRLQRLLDDPAFPNCRLHRMPDYRRPMDTYCANLLLFKSKNMVESPDGSHGVPFASQDIFGMPCCEEQCLDCRCGLHDSCKKCPLKTEPRDRSLSFAFLWQSPAVPHEFEAFFQIDTDGFAYSLKGGLTVIFDGRRYPHGISCRSATGSSEWPFYGAIVVTRHGPDMDMSAYDWHFRVDRIFR
jgi:hypothetical protein